MESAGQSRGEHPEPLTHPDGESFEERVNRIAGERAVKGHPATLRIAIEMQDGGRYVHLQGQQPRLRVRTARDVFRVCELIRRVIALYWRMPWYRLSLAIEVLERDAGPSFEPAPQESRTTTSRNRTALHKFITERNARASGWRNWRNECKRQGIAVPHYHHWIKAKRRRPLPTEHDF